MAATVSLGTLYDILANMLSNLTDNVTLAKDNLKIVKAESGAQLAATGTAELTMIAKTEAPMRLKEAYLMIQVTQAAGANSKSFRLAFDDGAGGSDTNLTSLYDGTATAVTAGQRNAMTVTAGVIIPAGSRVFLNCTTNGTGGAADIMCDVEGGYE